MLLERIRRRVDELRRRVRARVRMATAVALPPGMSPEQAEKLIEEVWASKVAQGWVESVLGLRPGQSITYEEAVERISRKFARGMLD